MELTEKTIKSDTVYQGKKVSLSLDTICCPNGDIVTKRKSIGPKGQPFCLSSMKRPFFRNGSSGIRLKRRSWAVPAGKADQEKICL
jgi:hypothetical protein